MITQFQLGDCVALMKSMSEGSVGSIVSDPPYGLEFMGMQWDKLDTGDSHVGQMSNSGFSTGTGPNAGRPNYGASANLKCRACNRWLWDQEKRKCQCAIPDLPNFKAIQNRTIQQWHEGWLSEALRVLRPGGLIKAFSSPRLFHRLATAMTNAGFEMLRLDAWVYGSGFPKNHNISRAIDMTKGVFDQRKVIGHKRGVMALDSLGFGGIARGVVGAHQKATDVPVTVPASPEGLRFWGYGTALKSCWEPFVVGRRA